MHNEEFVIKVVDLVLKRSSRMNTGIQCPIGQRSEKIFDKIKCQERGTVITSENGQNSKCCDYTPQMQLKRQSTRVLVFIEIVCIDEHVYCSNNCWSRQNRMVMQSMRNEFVIMVVKQIL